MSTYFVYLIQSSLCIAAFYLIYYLFLKKETFFKLNRFYLLSALSLSVLLPLVKYFGVIKMNEPVIAGYLQTIQINAFSNAVINTESFDFLQMIYSIYLIGVLFFAVRIVFQLINLFVLSIKSSKLINDNFSVYFVEKDITPFSFFRYIFLNQNSLNDKSLTNIIQHEKIHAKQFHSLDNLFVEIILIVQWFNPVIWLYKKSMEETHEYLADKSVVENGCDRIEYQQLIFNYAIGNRLGIASTFSSNIKKRIIMLSKSKSNNFSALKILLVVPVITFLLFYFSEITVIKAQNIVESTLATKNANKNLSSNKETFAIVEQMPEFPGGENAMRNFIAKNTKYPPLAREFNIQGKVFVRFIVDTDGSISDVSVLRKINKELDTEAVRVVASMPKWIPGKQRGKNVRVSFTVPIDFRLS